MIVSELEQKIREAIDQLPIERKKVFVLSRYEGLKYKEIAEVLEINPKSVGTMLVRAIDKLKLLLKTEYHELF